MRLEEEKNLTDERIVPGLLILVTQVHLLKSGLAKYGPWFKSNPTPFICMARELRMGFTFLNG